MPLLSHYHHLVLLLLVLTGSGVHCSKFKKVVTLEELQWRKSSISQPWFPQRSRKENGATILELRHHGYSPEPISNQEDKLQMILLSDNARISSLNSRMKKNIRNQNQEQNSDAQIPLTSGKRLQTLNYIVMIELGSKNMKLIVDTGSDLTWVQCQPCTSCYNQQDPIYDPSNSSSYKPISCNTSTCSSLQLAIGTSSMCNLNQPNCNYMVSYGDGSYTSGVIAYDQISLADTIVENFVFGCGQSNHGLFGGTSGLMGLGRNDISLISQTITQFGGVFSYCLPTKDLDSSGALILGNDTSSYRNTTTILYTRMIEDANQTPFYFLNLTGISIGGVNLEASGFSSGKIIIDSGTVISRLVPSIYNAVRNEFLKQFTKYPVAPGFSILDTCFDLSGNKEVNIPTMKMEFEGGAEIDIDINGVFYFVKNDNSQVCLALAALSYEDEVGIIGNYQQKNLRVVYDTVGSRLGFAEETCGYS